MKVVLVDDNPTALKMLVHAFTRAGYEVATATDGNEALTAVHAEQPDIVVLDVMMPHMDGIEATRRLRSNPDTASIPIILLTARDRIEDKLTGFETGADDYVVKPVIPAELIARSNALVRRSQVYTEAAPGRRGEVIAFLGVKGGVGTTSLAVNVASALAKSKKDVILADLHPTTGTVAMLMGVGSRASIATLAGREPSEISRYTVENSLERHKSGVQIFSASYRGTEHISDLSTEQLLAIVEQLEMMGDVIVLDLGSSITPSTIELMKRCHTIALVLAMDTIALELARQAVNRLVEEGLARGRLNPVVVNHGRSSATYTREEIEKMLGGRLTAVIAPAPEAFFHASKTNTPVVLSQPDTLIARQLIGLSSKLL